MEQPESAPRVALYIDAENLIIEAQKLGMPVNMRALMDRVREDGVLSVARAYADWTQPHCMPYTHSFQAAVIELTQLQTVYGKNTGDIQIVVDALELALGPLSPERFVIVAGDRDYVPLIQRLRRYRKHVTAVGLRESSSPQLKSICDAFWFYEDLLPSGDVVAAAAEPGQNEAPATAGPGQKVTSLSSLRGLTPEQQTPSPLPRQEALEAVPDLPADLRAAFELLMRAVGALDRNNQLAVLSNIKPKMQQLDPTFDFLRLNYETFQQFAEAAQQHGYVVAGPEVMGQRTLRPGRRPSLTLPAELQFSGRFESDSDALRFYREALANKRVPLIQWEQRRRLLEHLWERLKQDAQEQGQGLTLFEMTEVIADGAGRMFFNLPRVALEKLAYTALIGKAVAQTNPNEPELRQRRYHADCTLEEALVRTNAAYVRGIRMEYPDVVLMRRPLALLLYGTDQGDALPDIEAVMDRVR